MMFLLRLHALLGLALLLSLSACDGVDLDDDTGMNPPGVEQWAGSYTGQARFGGANGRWGNGGTRPLVVSANGQVTVRGGLIINPTFDAATNVLTWQIADGNATNGSITFSETSSSPTFADIGTGTVGQNFRGSIQDPGDGPLDYRGVLQ